MIHVCADHRFICQVWWHRCHAVKRLGSHIAVKKWETMQAKFKKEFLQSNKIQHQSMLEGADTSSLCNEFAARRAREPFIYKFS